MKKIIIGIIFLFLLISCNDNSVNIDGNNIPVKTGNISLEKSFSGQLVDYDYFFYPDKNSDIEKIINIIKTDKNINLKFISSDLFDGNDTYSIEFHDNEKISYDNLTKKDDYLTNLSEKFNLGYDGFGGNVK